MRPRHEFNDHLMYLRVSRHIECSCHIFKRLRAQAKDIENMNEIISIIKRHYKKDWKYRLFFLIETRLKTNLGVM